MKGVLNGEELTELQKEIDKLQDKKQKPAAKKSDCVFGAVVSLFRCVYHAQAVTRTENRTRD